MLPHLVHALLSVDDLGDLELLMVELLLGGVLSLVLGFFLVDELLLLGGLLLDVLLVLNLLRSPDVLDEVLSLYYLSPVDESLA